VPLTPLFSPAYDECKTLTVFVSFPFLSSQSRTEPWSLNPIQDQGKTLSPDWSPTDTNPPFSSLLFFPSKERHSRSDLVLYIHTQDLTSSAPYPFLCGLAPNLFFPFQPLHAPSRTGLRIRGLSNSSSILIAERGLTLIPPLSLWLQGDSLLQL